MFEGGRAGVKCVSEGSVSLAGRGAHGVTLVVPPFPRCIPVSQPARERGSGTASHCIAVRVQRKGNSSRRWDRVRSYGGWRAWRTQHHARGALPARHQRMAFARGPRHVRHHVVLGFVQSETRRRSVDGMASPLGGSWAWAWRA